MNLGKREACKASEGIMEKSEEVKDEASGLPAGLAPVEGDLVLSFIASPIGDTLGFLYVPQCTPTHLFLMGTGVVRKCMNAFSYLFSSGIM